MEVQLFMHAFIGCMNSKSRHLAVVTFIYILNLCITLRAFPLCYSKEVTICARTCYKLFIPAISL